MTIGKRLEFDLHESKILCVQLRKYKDHEEPFDLDIVCCSEDPRSWWNLIDTDSQPDTFPTLTCHLFSICPISASCECGFSMLGWLFHKYISISETFAETDDNDNEGEGEISFFINSDNCIILIESVWIEKFVDPLHNLIIKEIAISRRYDLLGEFVSKEV
ncbi:8529_t:CDS:2 [Entrophospora sp. SA101]|nr:8529_t:CDS:2 [Entrophospora sp. SA101]